MNVVTDAFRAYRKAPFSTALNVLTLSLGIGCFLAAWVVANYWSLTDAHFPNAERINVITQKFRGGDRATQTWAYSARPLAKYLRAEFPELRAVGRLREGLPYTVVASDWKGRLFGADADPELLDVFDFGFVHGDPKSALAAEGSVVLTVSAARRCFGDKDPIGETVLLHGDTAHTVTGVIEDVAAPSYFGNSAGAFHRFDFLRSWPEPPENQREWWLHNTNMTYVLLPEDATPAWQRRFNAQLATLGERHVPPDQRAQAELEFAAIGLDELVALYIDSGLFRSASEALSIIDVIYGLGALILIVASINFANLSLAQSLAQTREIGLEKVLGADRWTILARALTQAAVSSVAAAAIAWALLFLTEPLIGGFLQVDVGLVVRTLPSVHVLVGCIVVLVIVAVSAYPGLYVAGIHPMDALRVGARNATPRRVTEFLIGVQYLFSSALIIVIFVVSQQHEFMRDRADRVSADPVAVLVDDLSRRVAVEALANDLAAEPSVKAVSGIHFAPWSRCCIITPYTRSGSAGTNALVSRVGSNFFNVYDPEIVAGRVFKPGRDEAVLDEAVSGEVVSDQTPQPVVLDRSLARAIGFERARDAVGEPLYVYDPERGARSASAPARRIIGVVETIPLNFSAGHVRSNIYELGGSVPVVRLDEARMAEGLAAIKAAVQKRSPAAVVDIRLATELFDQNFKTYAGLYWVVIALSAVALAISCAGLFALASFITTRRRYEIGVRKVLGATRESIVLLVARDFLRPVLVAFTIASPVAFFAARIYLDGFMEKVAMTPMPWLVSFGLVVLVSFLVVSVQTIRAAQTPPADVIRNA